MSKLQAKKIIALGTCALVVLCILLTFVIPLQTSDGSYPAGGCSLIGLDQPKLKQTDFHVLRGELSAYQHTKTQLEDIWSASCQPGQTIRLFL